MSVLITPPATAVAAAQARDLVKVHGAGDQRVTALDHVDVEFAAATFTAVMGPSGSGKSTLMHCMAGLDSPDSGQVLVAGAELTAMSERRRTLLRREQVGFVFQSFNLIPALTARENILLPLALGGRAVDEEWFTELVTTLGLAQRLHHVPAQLSGGQQQRVAVARALVTRPALVFADEPTGNLDSASGVQLLRLVQQAVRTLGQTVVMVTHDPVAAAHADRVVFLADGRVVDELDAPTVDTVLARMTRFDAPQEV